MKKKTDNLSKLYDKYKAKYNKERELKDKLGISMEPLYDKDKFRAKYAETKLYKKALIESGQAKKIHITNTIVNNQVKASKDKQRLAKLYNTYISKYMSVKAQKEKKGVDMLPMYSLGEFKMVYLGLEKDKIKKKEKGEIKVLNITQDMVNYQIDYEYSLKQGRVISKQINEYKVSRIKELTDSLKEAKTEEEIENINNKIKSLNSIKNITSMALRSRKTTADQNSLEADFWAAVTDYGKNRSDDDPTVGQVFFGSPT